MMEVIETPQRSARQHSHELHIVLVVGLNIDQMASSNRATHDDADLIWFCQRVLPRCIHYWDLY